MTLAFSLALALVLVEASPEAAEGRRGAPGAEQPTRTSTSRVSARRGLLVSGSIAGAALIGAVTLSGLAYRESLRVTRRLNEEAPWWLDAGNDVCRLGDTHWFVAPYCRTLHSLKIAGVATWSAFGVAAATTIVFATLYGVRRSRGHDRLTTRLEPRVFITPRAGAVGALVRF